MAEIEELIKKIWYNSCFNKPQEPDINNFFMQFRSLVEDKLAGHGQLLFDDYLRIIGRRYDLEPLKTYVYEGKHSGCSCTYSDILHGVFFPRYEFHRNKYLHNKRYIDMMRICEELCRSEELSKEGKILLFDKCIHLMHNSGFIIENIDELRVEFDEEHRIN